MALFDGLQNFVPAFEGKRLAIQEGAAMHEGAKSLAPAIQKMTDLSDLDEWAKDYDADWASATGKKESAKKSPFGFAGAPDHQGTGPIPGFSGPPY